jgi:hypothetical protein
MLLRESWCYLPLGYVLSPEDIAAAEAAALSGASAEPSGDESGAAARAVPQQ